MADTFIIIFFIYSFLGYCCEVFYCSVGQKRFVNRGFLYGPYLPIYGFGSLVVTILLDPLSEYPLAVFIFAFVLTSCLEYFTSWLLEKLFSVKLWDYSKHKVNINGRVCLLNSTLFGLLGLVAEYFVQPLIVSLLDSVPSSILHYAAMLIVAVVSSDTVLSVMKMKAFKEGLERIRELRREAEERLQVLQGEGKAELAEELRKRIEATIEKYKESLRASAYHIVRANPSITSRNAAVQKQLSILHDWAVERKALRAKYKADRSALDKARFEEMRKYR